jgi:NAD(P)-dependent dehydrogenase (short-subunit alcohol dehydrogenase family)
MKDLAGKTAFVTGGASGIGYAMAKAFLGEGMRVMIADIEEEALAKAAETLKQTNAEVDTILCDVSVKEAMQDAARETLDRYGKVHVVCNNAGIGAGGPLEDTPAEDWAWSLGVNLMGVVHGTEVFLPHIRAQGEGGHIVNTASMAGMIGIPNFGPYCATKFAVVAMTEILAQELAETNIGASVLCPGFVRTRIHESGRARQSRFGGPKEIAQDDSTGLGDDVPNAVLSGIDPTIVGDRVVQAIKDGDLYIFTHPEFKENVEERFNGILAAFDKAAMLTPNADASAKGLDALKD